MQPKKNLLSVVNNTDMKSTKQEIQWTWRFWDMYACYYYAKFKKPSEWALIAGKRFNRKVIKWYGE